MSKQTKRYNYSSDKETKEFEIEVKLATDFRLFCPTATIPKELIGDDYRASSPRIYGNDFADIDTVIRAMIDKYENSFVEETREKIIAYCFETDDANQYEGHDLGIKYRVCFRYKSGSHTSYQEIERGQYRDINTLFHHQRHDHHKEMLWTAEREAWFTEMIRAMRAMSKQIKEGIGGSASVLARKIEHGSKILLTGGDNNGSENDAKQKSSGVKNDRQVGGTPHQT